MAYTACTAFSILMALLYQHRKRRLRPSAKEKMAAWIFCILSSFPLTFLAAFRYGLGTDYFNYLEISKGNYSFSVGTLTPIAAVLRLILPIPQFFIVCTSLFICGSFYYFVFKESENPALSIFLFVATRTYFRSLNVIRQYVAAAIFLYAIDSIKKNNKIKFFILLGLAVSVHSSSIIYILLFFLQRIMLPPKMIAILAVILFGFGSAFETYLIPLINQHTTYGKYFTAWSIYRSSKTNNSILFIYAIIFLILMGIYKKVIISDKLKMLYNAVSLGLLFSALAFSMPKNFWRIIWYFDTFIILYIPVAITAIKTKWVKQGVTIFIIVFFLIVAIVYIGVRGEQEVLPYVSIFSHTALNYT